MKTSLLVKNLLAQLSPCGASEDSESVVEAQVRNSLLEDIKTTQRALENAYAGFDHATDPDLIDCYIYEVNSALKRYCYLIHQAEKLHIATAQPISAIPLEQYNSVTLPFREMELSQ